MKTLAIMLALSMTGASALAQQATEATAQANTNTAKAADVKKVDEQRKDQSEEITNAKLRAEAGSKSKFSVQTKLSYQGGSIERPLADKRPAYRGGIETELPETSLVGSIAFAYRATDKITARLGTGLSVRRPFHNNDTDIAQNHYSYEDKERAGQKVMNISNPYLELSSAFRVGKLTLMPSANVSYSSSEYSRQKLKEDFSAGVSLTAVADIDGSNWQPGVTASIDNTFYQDSANESDVLSNENARGDYSAGIYPFIEYAFNDTYSFRTLVGFTFAHARSEAADTFSNDKVYQSMGLGIAVSQAVYIYPNVQFIPEDIRPERTNVGISTTFNVF